MSSNLAAIAKPDFSDAGIKLGRARDHIANVESQISAFLSTDFYRLRLKADQRTGSTVVILESLHQPDKTINAVIGDAVSNLRSALDYIAVALVEPFGGDPKTTGFPFADDANGFAGEVRAMRCFGLCPPEIQDIIIQNVQAYQGGKGHSLWAVNKLRNIDKHRLLVATVEMAGVIASWRAPNGSIFIDARCNVEAGESGVFIVGPIGLQFTDKPRPAFEIRFNEAPIAENVRVVALLKEGVELIERLIKTVDKAFN